MNNFENYDREMDEDNLETKYFNFSNQDLWSLDLSELQVLLEILENKYLLFDEDLTCEERKLAKRKLKKGIKKFAEFAETINNQLVREVKGFLKLDELENQLQWEFANSVPGRIRKVIIYKRMKR